jgi:hypothetical protein
MRRVVGGLMCLIATGVLVQCSDSTGTGEPAIALSAASVAVTGFAGGDDPVPLEIAISNGGTGTLTGLAAAVAYGTGQPTGWLTAGLSPDAAPAVLTLTATTGALAAGQYTATVSVTSDVATNSPQSVDVAFIVADPQSTWARLSARVGGSCGIMTVGAAYCWGANESGQIGDGRTGRKLIPTAVVGGLTFAELAVGNAHSCGRTPAGRAHCWGLNGAGQLGDGSTSNRLTATAVGGSEAFIALAAGDAHSCGLTVGGQAYCWGYNEFGQLGDGSTANRLTPTPVTGTVRFSALAAGSRHTCGLTAGGEAYCWGENEFGALGDSTRGNRAEPTAVRGGLTFQSISAGDGHTCGIATTGETYCWGLNGSGQLGDGTTGNRLTPTPVTGGLTFTVVVTGVGAAHTCGVAASGAPYCWGYNADGQVGDGTLGNRLSPTAVAGGLVLGSLAVGGSHSCGVTSAGGVGYCWGANPTGQLGDGTVSRRLTPVRLSDP